MIAAVRSATTGTPLLLLLGVQWVQCWNVECVCLCLLQQFRWISKRPYHVLFGHISICYYHFLLSHISICCLDVLLVVPKRRYGIAILRRVKSRAAQIARSVLYGGGGAASHAGHTMPAYRRRLPTDSACLQTAPAYRQCLPTESAAMWLNEWVSLWVTAGPMRINNSR